MSERRFVVCSESASDIGSTNGSTVSDRNNITAYLEGKPGWQIWHWFQNLWLIVIPENDPVTPLGLRQELEGFLGVYKHLLVMQVPETIRYSGRGDKGAWPWMGQNWGRPE